MPSRATDAWSIGLLLLLAVRPAPPADLNPREIDRLRATLHQRGMPELLRLSVDMTTTDGRERVASCAANEGAAMRGGPSRAALLDGAQREYAALTTELSRQPSMNETQQLALARYRVAWASIIYRFVLGSELDRFDAGSGLSRPAAQTTDQLESAVQALRLAERGLAGLRDIQTRDADRFLLLGIAQEYERLSCDCILNLAWAALWSARLAPQPSHLANAFADSLKRFDDLSRSACDASVRHAAALGSGIALRMLERADESCAVLQRLIDSKPPYGITVRAHVELGRGLQSARRFKDARAAWARLTAVDPGQLEPAYASAVNDIELARLLTADSYLQEAASLGSADAGSAANRDRLRRSGIDGLTQLAARGGAWAEIADTCLTARGAPRAVGQRGGAELVMAAQRTMVAREFAEAIALWRAALDKLPPGTARNEATFNLAVCLFQTSAIDDAAKLFEQLSAGGTAEPLAARAADHAYRCRARSAGVERTRASYVALADAAAVLLKLNPAHENAEEVAWIRAVANEEAGRIDAAVTAYAALPVSHRKYWQARRRMIDCRAQRQDASTTATQRAASAPSEAPALAAAYRALADDLRASAAKGDARADATEAVRAELDGAEWLASASAGQFAEALQELTRIETRGGLPAEMRGRLLAIRIRCHRGLNQLEQAAAVLDEFLRAVPADRVGDTLIGLAAGMESEVERLERGGQVREAKRMAVAALPTMRQLLNWIERQPDRAADKPTVRFSLARLLEQAGEADEAAATLDRLVAEFPRNGAYLLRAAALHESHGRAAGQGGAAELQQAEALWERLLADATLRESNAAVYWEARYRWLRLRLENSAGQAAAEIARAIDAERAWFPSLGGPPWAARLIELSDQARAIARRKSGK